MEKEKPFVVSGEMFFSFAQYKEVMNRRTPEYCEKFNKSMARQKTIKQIRDTLDGYLVAEKEQREVIERGRDGCGHSADSMIRSAKLEDELDSQYKYLERLLKAFGCNIHPVELIDIYSTSRIRAIQILEGTT